MVELDQFKAILNSYAKPLVEVRDSLDLANKEKRIEELERKMEEPDFWARRIMAKDKKVIPSKMGINCKNLCNTYFFILSPHQKNYNEYIISIFLS